MYTCRQDVLRERVCSWLKEVCGGYHFDELSMKAWTKDRARFEEHDISKELWYYDTASEDDDHALGWVVSDLLGNVDLWADTIKVIAHTYDGNRYQERFTVPKEAPVFVRSEAEFNEWKTKVL